MDDIEWAVLSLWQHFSEGGVGYKIGASTSVAGGSDEQGEARHSKFGLGCGYYSDGIHGRQATRVVYVTDGVTPTQGGWGVKEG